MELKRTKQALIDFQKKHENYLEAVKQYQDYVSLPFYKRWLTKTVSKPSRDYLYDVHTICSKSCLLIELRMYYSGSNKEITLAVNEYNCGYKLNLNTGEKSYYLGRVNPVVSEKVETLLESIRKELAPLYVE